MLFSHVWLFETIGFYRQEHWSGLHTCPSPGDLPNSGIKPRSPALQADSLPTEPPGNISWSIKIISVLVMLMKLMGNMLTLHVETDSECLKTRILGRQGQGPSLNTLAVYRIWKEPLHFLLPPNPEDSIREHWGKAT